MRDASPLRYHRAVIKTTFALSLGVLNGFAGSAPVPSALTVPVLGYATLSGPLAPALSVPAPLPAPAIAASEPKVTPGVRAAFAALPAGARVPVVVAIVDDATPLPKGDRKAKTDELRRRFGARSRAVAECLAAMGAPHEASWLTSAFTAELTAREIDALAALPAVEAVFLPLPLSPAW